MIQQTQLRVYMTSLIEYEKKNIQHHPIVTYTDLVMENFSLLYKMLIYRQ